MSNSQNQPIENHGTAQEISERACPSDSETNLNTRGDWHGIIEYNPETGNTHFNVFNNRYEARAMLEFYREHYAHMTHSLVKINLEIIQEIRP